MGISDYRRNKSVMKLVWCQIPMILDGYGMGLVLNPYDTEQWYGMGLVSNPYDTEQWYGMNVVWIGSGVKSL